MKHLEWLGFCAVAALVGLACEPPEDRATDFLGAVPGDPPRAFVETPGGRRISALAPASRTAAEPFAIAKFGGPITPDARQALARAGYREVSYLPYDALLLEKPPSAARPDIAGVVQWIPFRPEDRIARDLRPDILTALPEKGGVPVVVHVIPGRDLVTLRAVIVAHGGLIQGEAEAGAFRRIVALFARDAAANAIRAVGERSEVFLVERIHHVGLGNDKTAGTIQSGMQGHDAGQTPIWNHGIHGENQIVGIIDTGLDANSCYFDAGKLPVANTWSQAGGYGTMVDPTHRKIVAYDFLFSCDQWSDAANCEQASNASQWDTNNHGTHCAGNMIGDSDSNPETFAREDGMAPAAKIVVQDAGYGVNVCADLPGIGCPIVVLDPLFEQSRKQGASVHNNSWGDNESALPPGNSNYSARSQDVDRYTWEHREFLIVFAAGNSGGNNTDFSVSSPSTNKNGLSVGSARTSAMATTDDNISPFSSRGWSSDGRIKPDVMAPGCNASAGNDKAVDGTSNCGMNSGCGTSYASPIVVGAAALVRQYYTDGFYPTGAKRAGDAFNPSAALLKATLINSAVSMKGTDNAGGPISPIPSNEQGWGRIELDEALSFMGGARRLYIDDHRQGMPAGANGPFTYALNGVVATQPLKVTLAWTDYPGTPDSPAAAPKIDDASSWNAARLVNDLDLTVIGPQGRLLGNVFASGASVTGGGADRRNNVEQVLLLAPTAGTYTIVVQPFSIVQAGQEFALVVTGAWQSAGASAPLRDSGAVDTPALDGSTELDGTSLVADAPGAAGAAPANDAMAARDGAAIAPPADTGDAAESGCTCGIAHRAATSWRALLALALASLAIAKRRDRASLLHS